MLKNIYAIAAGKLLTAWVMAINFQSVLDE